MTENQKLIATVAAQVAAGLANNEHYMKVITYGVKTADTDRIATKAVQIAEEIVRGARDSDK